MNININRDFLHDYKDNAWRGFSAKELLSITIGVGIGISLAFIVYNVAHIPMAACVYVAIPAAFPVILIGFYKYQGDMNIMELLKAIRFTKKCGILLFEGDDFEDQEVFFMRYPPEPKRKIRKRRIRRNRRRRQNGFI